MENKNKQKFIAFTFDGTILPLCYKLFQRGYEVTCAMIEDNKDILTKGETHKPEDPEKKKDRHSLYKGILKVHDARKVLKAMKKIKDKKNYFIIGDSNNVFKYTQFAEKMGFTGFLPNEQDRVFEVERNDAKEFVKANYPDISIGEVQEFKTIDEGVQFLEDTKILWVLKSLGDDGDTVVPESEDPELAREQLIDSLNKQKKEYESNGFLLEEKIQDPIEITPEFVFWNGELIASSIDLENKPIGAGNLGSQTGCAQNLIFTFNIEDPLHKIACPQAVYDLAKARKGLFIWDISILIDKNDKMYFGEFCSNRPGWDSFPTEFSMCEDYFGSVSRGENPFNFKFGSAVRMFNIDGGGKTLEEGLIEWKPEADNNIFIYELQKKDDKFQSLAGTWDFGVATGVSDDLNESIDKCYENCDMLAFDAKYHRPIQDFKGRDYSTAILNRYQYLLDNKLINES